MYVYNMYMYIHTYICSVKSVDANQGAQQKEKRSVMKNFS